MPTSDERLRQARFLFIAALLIDLAGIGIILSTVLRGGEIVSVLPLAIALRTGRLAILDGVNRLPPGTISALLRLIEDREITLFDGSRYVKPERYIRMQEELGLTEAIRLVLCRTGFNRLRRAHERADDVCLPSLLEMLPQSQISLGRALVCDPTRHDWLASGG